MSEYVIDIESAPWNYEDYKEQFESSKKKPGLHAIISQIVCIGIHEIESNHSSVISLSNCDTETAILDAFTIAMKGRKADTMITFNGKAFDVPVLAIRAAKHGIPLKKCLPDNRSPRHIDIYADWLGGKWQSDIASCSLDELSWTLYGECKKSNGNQVAKWFSEGDYDAIDRHCLDDIKLTARIYNDLKECFR